MAVTLTLKASGLSSVPSFQSTAYTSVASLSAASRVSRPVPFVKETADHQPVPALRH